MNHELDNGISILHSCRNYAILQLGENIIVFKKYVEILEGKDVMSVTYSQMVQEKTK